MLFFIALGVWLIALMLAPFAVNQYTIMQEKDNLAKLERELKD